MRVLKSYQFIAYALIANDSFYAARLLTAMTESMPKRSINGSYIDFAKVRLILDRSWNISLMPSR